MNRGTFIAAVFTGLSVASAWAGPGDYDSAYDQGGGYGTATLDERVGKLEKKLSGEGQVEMLNRMEQLQSDVLRLRGEVEELTHQLESVKQQQKDMYQDLDRRLQAGASSAQQAGGQTETPVTEQEQPTAPPAPPIQRQAPAPASTPGAQAPAPVPSTSPQSPRQPTAAPAAPVAPAYHAGPATKSPTPASSADSEARQAAYQKAFNVLKESKYAEAIKEFKSFLAAYPRGEYSDNAAYWLAEAQYVNRDLPAAREAFRRVVKEFPQAAKVSDAQLKLGYIDYDSGQWASAREIFSDVIKRYPDSSAAKLAQKRLDKMKQEGH